MEGPLVLFRKFDTENSGKIGLEDMKQIFQHIGVEASDNEKLEDLFSMADVNDDGFIDYGELIAWLYNPIALTDANAINDQIESVLKSYGLLAERSAKYAISEAELVESESGILALLQRQLLLRLGRDMSDFHVPLVDKRAELVKLDAVQRLLTNKLLLETFLSSGDCKIANPAHLSPKQSNERWARAVEVMTRLMDLDPRVESGKPEDTLYMRLAVGAALASSSPIALLDDDSAIVDPVERYENYLKWHGDGLLFPSFEKLNAWQMRYLFICKQADHELEWAHENCSEMKRMRDELGEASSASVPNDMVQYKAENNGADIEDQVGYYGHGGHITLEDYHTCGGVCGAICFFATAMCQAFGLPAMLVGQPGHCAMIFQKRLGHWCLGNDISGWTASNDLEGGVIWDIPIMEQAQINYEDYSKSERLRTAAELAPSSQRGNLLAKASTHCPFNMAVWEARVKHIHETEFRGLDCDSETWVSETVEKLRKNWFGRESTIISKGKAVHTSDAAYEYHSNHVVDCADSIWWTEQNEVSIDIDLGELRRVNQVSIVWAGPCANTYRMLASPDEPSWPKEVSRGCAVRASEFQDMASAVTDGQGYGGGDTIWFAEGNTAWIVIELKEQCEVTELHIEWWGLAVASSYVISSSADGIEFEQQRTQEDAKSHPDHLGGEINGWSGGIPGWASPTTHIKLELADGHEDGWSHNKLFGIRNVRVMGYDGKSKRDGEINFEEVGKHQACKMGCGRGSAPPSKGRTFNTCCRNCAKGAEHTAECDERAGLTMLPGWSIPTRVVRLELVDAGAGSEKFGIQQVNVHGGSNSEPSTAMEVLRAEVSYCLDKETVCQKYYGGDRDALRTGLASESSSGKDRPLLCALDYIHSLMDHPAHLHSQFSQDEQRHWTEQGFPCSLDARVLICENTSAQGDEFSTSREQCGNNGPGGWAEYTVEFAESGTYDIYTHLAADDLRPLWLHLDGEKIDQLARHGTHSWSEMKWFREKWQLEVKDAGVHTIRLDTDGFYPGISAVAFCPPNPNAAAFMNDLGDDDEYVSTEFWACEAFQICGFQADFDRVMRVEFSLREAEYLKIKSEAADDPEHTRLADAAFQLRGSQEDYDRVMSVEVDLRGQEYEAIELEARDDPNHTKWADEAFQLRGSQEDYDRVMGVDASLRFNEYNTIKREASEESNL